MYIILHCVQHLPLFFVFWLLFSLLLFITSFIYVAEHLVIAIFWYWRVLSWIKIQNKWINNSTLYGWVTFIRMAATTRSFILQSIVFTVTRFSLHNLSFLLLIIYARIVHCWIRDDALPAVRQLPYQNFSESRRFSLVYRRFVGVSPFNPHSCRNPNHILN